MEKTNTEHENEFKEIEITREVILKQNSKTGKIELVLNLKDYDLNDLLLQEGRVKKSILGKINIRVLR